MRDHDGFADIGDYGFLSDCRSAALVADDGSIDWFCLPRFDSASLFAALLDPERGGFFRICPTTPFRSSRRYLGSSNVLRTTFETDSGVLELDDWLHTGARQSLCRLVRCTRGKVSFRAELDARPDYGRRGPAQWQPRMGYLVLDEDDLFVLDGFDSVAVEGPLSLERELERGDNWAFTLCLDRPGPSDLFDARGRAIAHWESWAQNLILPQTARAEALRSALVLKGLQYEPSGAIIAAPTTSLPEDIGGGRNWDYRFSWLRDSSFTLHGLKLVGKEVEAQSYFDWLKGISVRAGHLDLQIMYGPGGETDLEELELHHLSGYRHSRPVRIGNGAASQRQTDVYGELMDALWQQRRRAGRSMHRHRIALVRALCQRTVAEWREPDEGIWEVRIPRQHFVYSKVMCWTALDRAVKLAHLDRQAFSENEVALWRRERDAIRAEVMQRGISADTGAFTMVYDQPHLDAANLLLAQIGFVGASDEHFRQTVYHTERQLMPSGLVLRYSPEAVSDQLGGEEGAFVLCSFWMVLALIAIGEETRARQLFDQILERSNDLHLLAEQLSGDGQQLGNFPQAFSHLALIACAFALDRAGADTSAPPELAAD